jgi:hypothetical protein
MIAEFIKSSGPYLEATIKVGDKYLVVMDEFSESVRVNGCKFNVEIYPGLVDERMSWDAIFNSNPNKIKELQLIQGWEYQAFGQICSIKPTIVDCGLLKLEAPICTNDTRVIGEWISFIITRLDASEI